jgi:hypothetical protein
VGFSVSWIALKDLPLTEAALAFGLTSSDQSGETFDYEVSGANVGDWTVLVFNDVNTALAEEELVRLSRRDDVVVVHVHETTMMQTSEMWRQGRQVWSVWHDTLQGERNLEEEGEFPPAYDEIKQRLFAQQDEEDAGDAAVDFVSEIPIELAAQVTGFRHDRMGAEFFELVPGDGSKPRKASFLGRLKTMFRQQ